VPSTRIYWVALPALALLAEADLTLLLHTN
jgi:hypothetical protein